MKVSVVLPTYNEAENITAIVHEIFASLRQHETEILVVDDDSPDGTWHIAEQIGSHFGRLRVVRRQAPRSFRASLSDGISLTRGEIVCWMNADFSMPPSLLTALVDAVATGQDLAVGSRYVTGGSDSRAEAPLHRFLSRTLTRTAGWLLSSKLRDSTSGFIAVRRTALDHLLPLEGDRGGYFMTLVCRAQQSGLKVMEVPYALMPRRAGQSKTASGILAHFSRAWSYLRLILSLRHAGTCLPSTAVPSKIRSNVRRTGRCRARRS